jgi:hypothetical protein
MQAVHLVSIYKVENMQAVHREHASAGARAACTAARVARARPQELQEQGRKSCKSKATRVARARQQELQEQGRKSCKSKAARVARARQQELQEQGSTFGQVVQYGTLLEFWISLL